jgi:hypothetical protein
VRPDGPIKAVTASRPEVSPPLTLGVRDCAALLVSAVLLFVAALWPSRASRREA